MSQALMLHLAMMVVCWWLAADEVKGACFPRPDNTRIACIVRGSFFLAVSYQAAQQVFP